MSKAERKFIASIAEAINRPVTDKEAEQCGLEILSITLEYLKEHQITFLVLEVNDATPNYVGRIAETIEIVYSHHGQPIQWAAFCFCAFGLPMSASQNPNKDRDAAILALSEHFQENIRIVYGNVLGLTGSLGVAVKSGHFFSSEGPWLSHSSEIVCQLLNIKFGEAKAFVPPAFLADE